MFLWSFTMLLSVINSRYLKRYSNSSHRCVYDRLIPYLIIILKISNKIFIKKPSSNHIKKYGPKCWYACVCVCVCACMCVYMCVHVCMCNGRGLRGPSNLASHRWVWGALLELFSAAFHPVWTYWEIKGVSISYPYHGCRVWYVKEPLFLKWRSGVVYISSSLSSSVST